MTHTFSGGWMIDVSSSTVPRVQSVNLLPLPTSPFGVPLNGTIGATGILDASGDSKIEFLHLLLNIPLSPIDAPTPVTGSAEVKLHFLDSPVAGTVAGDCAGTYTATGMLALP